MRTNKTYDTVSWSLISYHLYLSCILLHPHHQLSSIKKKLKQQIKTKQNIITSTSLWICYFPQCWSRNRKLSSKPSHYPRISSVFTLTTLCSTFSSLNLLDSWINKGYFDWEWQKLNLKYFIKKGKHIGFQRY